MRVLILNHNLRERGTYFRSRKVAEGLHRRGHDVTFVCTGPRWYRPTLVARRARWTEWETASWSPLHREEGHSPLGILQRMALLRGPWDLVYTFSHLPLDQAAARFLRSEGTFWMTDWCDLWNSRQGGAHDLRRWARPLPDFMHGVRGAWYRTMFRMEDQWEAAAPLDADATSIIVSPMRERTRRLGIADDRVLHLVSGADTQRIPVLDRAECRSKLGLPAGRPIIGYVANYTPDNVFLQKALRRVWKERPDALLLSVGPRWYDPGSIAAWAVEAGRMIDMDRRPFAEVPLYLGAADLLVMPLRPNPFNECRWPNKFGDYMAAGRPTATNDVGDMGEVTRRLGVGVAGAPTADGLADAMLRLLDDEDLRLRCGVAARRAAEHQFSWSGRLHRLCKYLRGRGVAV